MYQHCIKRCLDILLSLIALTLFLPLMLICAVWIRLDSPGPALFKQKRIGAGDSTFTILKFRTMRQDTPPEVATHLMTDASSHITRCGRILRCTSLDELPQLINILRGDMSFVGPRPALWNQFDLIQMRKEHHVDRVKPGLTGWAQVNGRDMLDMTQKVQFDAEYVQRLSFLMDLRCLWRTVAVVLQRLDVVGKNDENAASEAKTVKTGE